MSSQLMVVKVTNCNMNMPTYLSHFLVKSLMTLKAPNVMVHEMKGTNGGKDSICVREFFGDKMVATCKCEDIETVRTYTAV